MLTLKDVVIVILGLGVFLIAIGRIFPFGKNFIGHLNGFGSCGECGGTWNWKEGHSIMYYVGVTNDEYCKSTVTDSEGNTRLHDVEYSRGMFPLCEECYQKLNIMQIMKHVVDLVNEWERQYPQYTEEEQRALIASVERSVRKEKAGGIL